LVLVRRNHLQRVFEIAPHSTQAVLREKRNYYATSKCRHEQWGRPQEIAVTDDGAAQREKQPKASLSCSLIATEAIEAGGAVRRHFATAAHSWRAVGEALDLQRVVVHLARVKQRACGLAKSQAKCKILWTLLARALVRKQFCASTHFRARTDDRTASQMSRPRSGATVKMWQLMIPSLSLVAIYLNPADG
jgi:hypothetical protein